MTCRLVSIHRSVLLGSLRNTSSLVVVEGRCKNGKVVVVVVEGGGHLLDCIGGWGLALSSDGHYPAAHSPNKHLSADQKTATTKILLLFTITTWSSEGSQGYMIPSLREC